jgi:sodium pump decarboxylase gamma subunit
MNLFPVFLSSLTMDQKIALSGEMILKGMGTVFMVLVILWAILSVFGKFFGAQQKKPQAPKKTVEAPAPKQEAAPAPASVPAASDDGALIAAITAAIEAYRAEEGRGALPFRVVSFKRKNGSNGWNNSNEN